VKSRNQSLDLIGRAAIAVAVLLVFGLLGLFAYADSGSIADTALRIALIIGIIWFLVKKDP
jgi:uncharacterized membrane protein